MASLEEFNYLRSTAAETELLRCCGSRNWAREVAKARPFSGDKDLFEVAEQVWRSCTREDRLEAFAHHPRIGEAQLREKFAATAAWAEQEQEGAAGAGAQTLTELANGNREYENRFGYVFLVCATGKSADEMLAILKTRIHNEPEAELQIAAGEQAKITRIRLEKWLKS